MAIIAKWFHSPKSELNNSIAIRFEDTDKILNNVKVSCRYYDLVNLPVSGNSYWTKVIFSNISTNKLKVVSNTN